MATGSYIIKSNGDGSFSGRYHHRDGFPSGLGLFLSNFVNTPDRVDWLFSHKRGFSSLLCRHHPRAKWDNASQKDYQKGLNDGSILDYPASFGAPEGSFVGAHLSGDKTGMFENAPWIAAAKIATEEYTYLFMESAWHLVVKQKHDFEACVFVPVKDVLGFEYMMQHLPETIEKHQQGKLSEREEVLIQTWFDMPAKDKRGLLKHFQNEFDLKEETRQFEKWANVVGSKKSLQANLDEAKQTFPIKNTRKI